MRDREEEMKEGRQWGEETNIRKLYIQLHIYENIRVKLTILQTD